MERWQLMTNMALIVMILAAGTGLYFAGENVGFNRATSENNASAAKVTEDALIEQTRLQNVTQEQADIFNTAIIAERLAHERTRNNIKSITSVKSCIRDSGGDVTVIINDDTIRMLDETRSSKALPEASNTKRVVKKESPITANILAVYSEYSISEYNQCAIQLNSLIEIIKKANISDNVGL